MAERIVLEATRRDVLGKQVKHLRAEGQIPGVLYGPTFKPEPIQLDWLKLRPILREAGGSHLIQIQVDGEECNVLVREVQRDPIRGEVLHIDFYRVQMDVLIRADAPIGLIGNDTAITKNAGVVMQEMNSIMIECLPGDLPPQVEIDLSLLKNVGDRLLVRDLPPLPGVRYLAGDNDVVVLTVAVLMGDEEEEEAASAEPELIRRRPDEETEE